MVWVFRIDCKFQRQVRNKVFNCINNQKYSSNGEIYGVLVIFNPVGQSERKKKKTQRE